MSEKHCLSCKNCFVAYGYEPDSILMKRCKLKQEQFTLEDSVECKEFKKK
ncbi:MAG: hypothetical protein Q4Q19_03350 [Methanobrevibacter sp.]|nr:hypothetical protein [Methanobrevibacter sp.]